MQLKTILNRVQKFKSFVYGAVRWVEAGKVPALEVDVHPRVGSRGRCSGCGRQRAGYDRLSPRRFEFVPLWGLKVFLVYAPRRVDCPACGVKVERMPWAG
jgi:transposase